MPQWAMRRVEDMAADEGRPSENAINSVFLEQGDYSNVLNECADGDDNDSHYYPEDDTSYDGIINWNQ